MHQDRRGGEARQGTGLEPDRRGHRSPRHLDHRSLLGQASMDEAEATKAAGLLGFGREVVQALQRCPMRGSLGSIVPTDPRGCRSDEIVQVDGTTLAEIIHEQFGDGIMCRSRGGDQDFRDLVAIERTDDELGAFSIGTSHGDDVSGAPPFCRRSLCLLSPIRHRRMEAWMRAPLHADGAKATC